MRRYWWNVVRAMDFLLNALTGGEHDEYLSVRMGRRVIQRRCRFCLCACWLLSLIDSDHCRKQYEQRHDANR